MTWRIAPGQTLRLRRWEDECVLYNDLSGDTHLLGAVAASLLDVLGGGAASLPELAQALCGELGVEADAELEAALAPLLDQLAHLALIETLPC